MLISRRDILMAWLVAAVTAGALGPVAAARADERQKQVLVLFSTGRGAQFAVVVERNLPSLLLYGMKEGVDYSPNTSMPRCSPARNIRIAYRDSLRLKYQAQRIDLVIAVGRLAIEFIASNRADALPEHACRVLRHRATATTHAEFHGTGEPASLQTIARPRPRAAARCRARLCRQRGGRFRPDNEQRARMEFLPLERRLDFTYLSGLVTEDLEARLQNVAPTLGRVRGARDQRRRGRERSADR